MNTDNSSVVPFVRWNPDWTPGERIVVNVQYLMPNAGDFWNTPVLLVEQATDTMIPLNTLPLQPWNEHFEKHPVYAAGFGESWSWYSEDDNETNHYRLLGIYTPTSLVPNDSITGMLTLEPADPGSPIKDSSDPRWATLKAYLDENEVLTTIRQLNARERGEWYAYRVLKMSPAHAFHGNALS